MLNPFLCSEKGLTVRAALGLCMLASAVVAWLLFVVIRQPQQAGRPMHGIILRETGADSLPDISRALLADPNLKTALQNSLDYLKRLSPEKTLPFGGREIGVRRLRESLDVFLNLVDLGLSDEELRKRIGEEFVIFRVVSNDDDQCGGEAAPVLVTGYFQPEIDASYVRAPGYEYPLYGVPDDLVEISLRDFDATLPARRLFGRVAGRKVLPYYSRYEIDTEGKLSHAPVLAWIPDEIDGLMLHIQGSGLLRFPDGKRRFVHFAASNGRPYGSIGKWLIKKGWLKAEDADWPGIRKWAVEHPELFTQALRANPRYIFFKWEDEGPVGSMGAVLEPMRSVAMDPSIYPQGCLCLLDIKAERPLGFTGFVLNQDRGSAIKGPCRVDLYCGAGERAGEIAGRLRHRANLYLFLKKSE